MKRLIAAFATGLAAMFAAGGCGMTDGVSDTDGYASSGLSSGEESGGGDGGQTGQNRPGVITAGEWNDLDNWEFWKELLATRDYGKMPDYWSFYTNNRVAVELTANGGEPVVNATVTIKRDGTPVAKARTGNRGRAELWLDPYQKNGDLDYSLLTLEVNGEEIDTPVIPFEQGVCEVTVADDTPAERSIELAFMVDATGSMGDEMEYLKTELVDVVGRVEGENPGASILTAAVFYRDKGDDYLTRISNFTGDVSTTNAFINKQSAGGGGDFPEAVHTALDKTVSELQWSDDARTKIVFILLDAPPHYESSIVKSLQSSVTGAMEKGIRVIPVMASGIDKETEFLMRFIAISTNGTYVFITDDSGIGNPHLEPSVGQYTVEPLNDLMVRLINEYSE